MATRLEIINAALLELGEDVIQFEEDDLALNAIGTPVDDIGQMSLSTYPHIRDAFLNAHAWSWLTERVALERTTSEPSDSFPFRYEFTKPRPNIGNIRAVYDAADVNLGHPNTTEWTLGERFLYAAFPEGWADVQRNVTEEAYPDLVVNALILTLCERWSVPITEDETITRMYRDKAAEALQNARRVDSQSQPTRRFTNFSYVQARLGNAYGVGGGGRRYVR